MRKLSILLVSLFVVLTSGCADVVNKEYGPETFVYTYEEMGCSTSFSNITLGRFASTVYDTEVVLNANCNSKTTIRIEFFDNALGPGGHYLYFLVNGYNTGYEARFGAYEPAYFTFKADPNYTLTPGTFYGTYRVIAINRENGRYTYRDYNITAYDNYFKTAAPSLGEFKLAPEFVLEDENASITDNKTQEPKKEDNATNQAM